MQDGAQSSPQGIRLVVFPDLGRSIWLERNTRVLRNGARLPDVLCVIILELVELWCKTRLLSRTELFGE